MDTNLSLLQDSVFFQLTSIPESRDAPCHDTNLCFRSLNSFLGKSTKLLLVCLGPLLMILRTLECEAYLFPSAIELSIALASFHGESLVALTHA